MEVSYLGCQSVLLCETGHRFGVKQLPTQCLRSRQPHAVALGLLVRAVCLGGTKLAEEVV